MGSQDSIRVTQGDVPAKTESSSGKSAVKSSSKKNSDKSNIGIIIMIVLLVLVLGGSIIGLVWYFVTREKGVQVIDIEADVIIEAPQLAQHRVKRRYHRRRR